jgi:phage-related protein
MDSRNPPTRIEWRLPRYLVAKFKEVIYVLHCFQKKTEATNNRDKSIATARYLKVLDSQTGIK